MPKIAIIGRQNVGKSTLFNALIGKRKTITYDEPGSTRDIVHHEVNWGEGRWEIADFPGFEDLKKIDSDDLSHSAIEKAIGSLKDYHLLLWLISRQGLSEYEHRLHEKLRQFGKKYWLVVNFVDDPSLETETSELYRLGVKETFFVSALNRRNLNELVSRLRSYFSSIDQEDDSETETPALTIAGKPNAGKSTLYNLLLKKEQALVSPIPGTTRDSLEANFSFHGQAFRIIDTAGLRKNTSSLKQVDKLAEQRSMDSIQKASVVILLINPKEGFDRQNKNMIKIIHQLQKPMVAAVNKLDQLRQEPALRESLTQEAEKLQKMFWKFPLYFISAAQGDRVVKVIEEGIRLHEKSREKYPTPKLNQFMQKLKNDPILSNHRIKPFYITQIGQRPEFILFTNKKTLPPMIQKFLIRKIQEFLKIPELPARLQVRERRK